MTRTRAALRRQHTTGFMGAWAYVHESRSFILIAVALFIFSALIGFLFPSYFSFFDDTLRELVRQTEGLNPFQLFLFIFRNNLLSSLFALFLGFFFGVFPIFTSLVNGAVLGYVVSRTIPLAGVASLWRLLPHGLFELPAIFIAIGLGIKFGMAFFHPSSPIISQRFSDSLQAFVYLVLPLLFVAALIEALLIAFF